MSEVNIVDTDNGNDLSAIPKIILINPQGYSVENPTVLIVNTQNGTDFSAVQKMIIVDLNGDSVI